MVKSRRKKEFVDTGVWYTIQTRVAITDVFG
jgi:hypothetical protein